MRRLAERMVIGLVYCALHVSTALLALSIGGLVVALGLIMVAGFGPIEWVRWLLRVLPTLPF